ncbi:hypothetical protein ONS95_007691 [Cadophora gregata]|uniref:uncharacterized protein n=1 Tax=Cadophora gregata TaxID=51156 RepID=UPI0026DCDE72|nr:uncharacterized protein ONS95_007691 [Cadophora gregata]KAK0118812.1 hypothetical protein ONS96_011894 [Cadophora gregata f. sp. sojae]KAK0126071.1 hypothetical protein ONS95_007691 [Cadophora gregata]
MDTPPTGELLGVTESYAHIHSIARQVALDFVPGDGTYAVAVLQHDKLHEVGPENFYCV